MSSKNILSSQYYANLKLGQKLTAVLGGIFIAGSILSGLALSSLLNQSAQREIASQALILMNTMNSVRNYTTNQIQPELVDRLDEEFLPQTVPAYSATEVFDHFRTNENYEQFFYKEATLNPTNPRDQADEFETQIVEQFRNSNDLDILQGFRNSDGQEIFYTAKPLKIGAQSCLQCHSTPDIAPVTMIEKYGSEGGFGWQLNEIIGSQVVFVPASIVIDSARRSFFLSMSIVVGIFALVIVAVNFWLRKTVVTPITRMTQVAEVVSHGDLEAEFQQRSNDEVGQLAESFSRMKTSFQLAMKKLERLKQKYSSD
ncbi:MAG: DUF3365 domain-containing protein [Cyanobacterium sp. T60_A2020_053]|nr:DUF3365 domain-containing protein [Cyanobacterium sp. T60_A2020_053]